MKKEDLKIEFRAWFMQFGGDIKEKMDSEAVFNFFEPHLKLKSAKPKIELPEDKIIEFNEIFPKIKGGSGKSLRCNLKELTKAFEWFFKNYEYDWNIILDAAKKYVIEQERENFKFCRTAKYFIVKWRTPSQPESLLAELTVQVLEGDYFEGGSEDIKFETKIY